MNGLRARVQTFATISPIPKTHSERDIAKATAMGLLKTDLFRPFFLGFGVTALVLGVNMITHLV